VVPWNVHQLSSDEIERVILRREPEPENLFAAKAPNAAAAPVVKIIRYNPPLGFPAMDIFNWVVIQFRFPLSLELVSSHQHPGIIESGFRQGAPRMVLVILT
jgi:hypothetical protein